jgi:hypothetical protein
MDGDQKPSEEPTWQFKPGETISPRAQTSPQPVAPTSPAPEPESKPNVQAAQQAPPPPATPPPAAETRQPLPTAAPEVNENNFAPADYTDSDEALTWTASEFIAHDKTAGWHVGLIVAAVLVAVILWFITRDIITAIVVIVAGGVLSLYGGRRPRELQYQLNNHGLSIGPKQFSFRDFRAFSVVPEGAFASISLLPTKRFAPMTTLYFDPADADKILDILSNHLPAQPMKADAIDSLMRKIRF